jgi:glycerol uptake facilitator-like aquaporin
VFPPERIRAVDVAPEWGRAVAEGLGTAFLLAAVVGSGIVGERLSGGNAALALLANSFATGCALVALILAFGNVSGAHFNPWVTLSEAWTGSLPWRLVPGYIGAQLVGAFVGVAAANAMFSEPLLRASRHARAGLEQRFAEVVATFGLIVVIRGSSRAGTSAVAFAVGTYIAAAFWFTSSTSFANPAVTLARCFTDTFTGIRPADAPGFLIAQFVGAFLATMTVRRFFAEG